MRIFDELAEEWREHAHHSELPPHIGISNVEERVAMHLAMTGESQALASTPASLETTPTGGKPVSNFTDAKTALHDGLNKLEAIDEAAAGKLEALQGNPGAMSLVDAALGALHVPPEGFAVIVATLQGVANLWDKPVDATAAPAAAA